MHRAARLLAPLSLFVALAHPLVAQAPEWTHHEDLPAPSGRFPVGVSTVHLVDSSRQTSRHVPVRPLTAQVWYPAKRIAQGTSAPYLTEAGLLDSMIQRKYLDLEPDEMRGWADMHVVAVLKAPPALPSTSRGWPVLVLSHGLGVARAHYSALSQELASHGYSVLTLDHPLGGFTLGLDGKVLAPGVDSVPPHYGDRPMVSVVRDWALDAGFMLRALANESRRAPWHLASLVIDTTQVGMLGHSLGGAAALEACRSIALVSACADMDGYPFGDVESQGVGRPFLVLLSQPDHDNRPPPRDSAEASARERFSQMGRERDSTWAAICAHDPREPCFVVKIKGTGHLFFSDAPFQAPSLLRNVGATLSPRRQQQLIASQLLEFFDHFLREQALRTLRPGPVSIP